MAEGMKFEIQTNWQTPCVQLNSIAKSTDSDSLFDAKRIMVAIHSTKKAIWHAQRSLGQTRHAHTHSYTCLSTRARVWCACRARCCVHGVFAFFAAQTLGNCSAGFFKDPTIATDGSATTWYRCVHRSVSCACPPFCRSFRPSPCSLRRKVARSSRKLWRWW